LKYEDLISDPEKKTRSLLDFCNLDWDKNCLNFKDNKREVKNSLHYMFQKKMRPIGRIFTMNYPVIPESEHLEPM